MKQHTNSNQTSNQDAWTVQNRFFEHAHTSLRHRSQSDICTYAQISSEHWSELQFLDARILLGHWSQWINTYLFCLLFLSLHQRVWWLFHGMSLFLPSAVLRISSTGRIVCLQMSLPWLSVLKYLVTARGANAQNVMVQRCNNLCII